MTAGMAKRVLRSMAATLLLGAVSAYGATNEPAVAVTSQQSHGSATGALSTTLTGTSARLSAQSGGLVLSWLDKTPDRSTVLRAARIHRGVLDPAFTVAQGWRWFANPYDKPSVVALSQTSLVAHWLRKSAHATYAYDILLTASDDGGQSWRYPVVAHTDRSPVQHGFVDMHAIDARTAQLIWLDGRKTAGDAIDSPMALRSARFSTDGQVTQRAVIDPLVCSCCQPALGRVGQRWLAAYRDRTEAEVRDIVVRQLSDTGANLRHAFADGWTLRACPVNGPALASTHGRALVAWFTAAGGQPRIRAALSVDGGDTFLPTLTVADTHVRGQVDALALVDDATLVTWIAHDARSGTVQGRVIRADGSMASNLTSVRSSTPILSAQVACDDGKVLLVWEAPSAAAIHVTRAFPTLRCRL